jgi:hypothetical protein
MSKIKPGIMGGAAKGGLKAIGKFFKPIAGALGLSALAFGAGSAMAANSGAGTGNEY